MALDPLHQSQSVGATDQNAGALAQLDFETALVNEQHAQALNDDEPAAPPGGRDRVGDETVLRAQATVPASATNGRPPQRQEDLRFSFFDSATGETVSVTQPLWKDDTWNLGGYFTVDRNGNRHDISAWSPAAARGQNAREVVLNLINSGSIDPRNVTVTQTHQQMLGAMGRPYWSPTARTTAEDGMALYQAQSAAGVPTDSAREIRPNDTPAFAEGYRNAELSGRVIAGYAVAQTVLGIAGAASRGRALARQNGGRGAFDVVNPNTGQRLRVTSNNRTGGINGTLFDRNGRPIASQTTVGRDSNRTVNVTPNTASPTNVTPGALATTVAPGAVSRPLTVSGTPVTIRSQNVNGVENFSAIYGPNGQNVVPLPGATNFDQASQQVANRAAQGNLPGFTPAGPVVTDSPLSLSSGGRNYQFTIRNTQNHGQSNYSVAYRIGGQNQNYSLPGARSLSEASQQVVGAFNDGRLPGIVSGGPVVTSNPLTLSRGGQTFDVTVRNTQIDGQSNYTVAYRVGGRDHEYRLPGATNLSQASQQVTNALNGGTLPGISASTDSRLTLTSGGRSYAVTINNIQIGNRSNYSASYRINNQTQSIRLPGATNLRQASQQVTEAFNQGRLPGLTPARNATPAPAAPPQQPAANQPGGSVGAMSANQEPPFALTPQETASATDLTQRFPTLEGARAYAETQPEARIFSYTDRSDQLSGELFYFRGGQAGEITPFISQDSMFHPDAAAFNRAINGWSNTVEAGLASANPQDRDLRQILSQIEPDAQQLAREQFPNRPNIRRDYGRERLGGARMTELNHQAFSEFIPPTLDMMKRDWANVSLMGGGRPSFPASELQARLDAGDPEAQRLVYAWTIETPNGVLPTAFTTIEPPNPSILGNPYPFTMTTFYPSNPESVASIKAALSERWTQMQSIPAGDPRAVDAIADFMYDYNKLYWHWHGDGEIGLGLMSGYLESKGFHIERMNPNVDLNGQSFQTTREEYIENFRNGAYFDLTPNPGPRQSSANPITNASPYDITSISPRPGITSTGNVPDIRGSYSGGNAVPQDPIGLANYINGLSPGDLEAVINGPQANEYRIVLRHSTELAGAPYRTNMGISAEQHGALSNNLSALRDAWSALSPTATTSDIAAGRDLPRTVSPSEAREILLADGVAPDRVEDYLQQSNGLISYWPNDQITGLPNDFYTPGSAGQGTQDLTAFDNALTGPLYPLPSGGFLVSPRLPSNTQLFVFGDIHGTSNLYSAIQDTAERLTTQGRNQDPDGNLQTVIASIGDLGNKGPDTASVAEDLLARTSRYADDPNTDFLIFSGNHEDPATYGTLLDVNADVGNSDVRSAIQDILKKGGYLTLESFERRAVAQGQEGFSVDINNPPDPKAATSIPYYRELQQDIARIVPQEYRELALNLPLANTIGDFFLSHGGGDPRTPRFSFDQGISLDQISPAQDFRWTRLPGLASGNEGSLFFDLREPVYPIFGHTMNVRPAETPFGFDLDSSAFRAWQMAGLYIPPNGQGETQLVLVRQTDGPGREVEVRVVPIETALREGLIDTRFDETNLVPNREEKSDREMIQRYMDRIQP